ncbi:ABC transporter substrate-binding protein [Moorella naiadis]|uniref:ABC transporter substrate-binding protein n=1 Tax=Moorella naiadis (nom. illeg.) TaxID=3093670 RepID=UPI003D9CB79D
MLRRKTLLAIVFFTLSAVFLVSCGSKTSTSPQQTSSSKASPVQLEFWYALPGAQGQVVKDLVDEFNKTHPTIQISTTFIPTAERLTKITAAIAGGGVPDLYTAGPPDLAALQGAKSIVPLNDLAKPGELNIEDYYPGPRKVVEKEGKIWALPVSAGIIGLYYNKDLFKAAGLDPDKPPRTWNELVTYAQKLTDQSKEQWGLLLPTQADLYLTTIWLNFFWQNGGQFLTPDGQKAAFNSKEGADALQFWVDLFHKYKVAPLVQQNETSAIQTFATGKVGMLYAMPLWIKNTHSFPFAVGTAVLPRQINAATTLGGWYVTIMAGSHHQAEAWTFLKWLAEPEHAAKWNIGMGSLPTSRQNQAFQKFAQNEPLVQPFLTMMAEEVQVPPTIKQYAEISMLVANAIHESIYQKKSPKEALDAAALQADTLLQKK